MYDALQLLCSHRVKTGGYNNNATNITKYQKMSKHVSETLQLICMTRLSALCWSPVCQMLTASQAYSSSNTNHQSSTSNAQPTCYQSSHLNYMKPETFYFRQNYIHYYSVRDRLITISFQF